MKFMVRYIIPLFFLLTTSATVIAQTATSYKAVDEFIKNFPFKPSGKADIKVMAREIKRAYQTDDEKVRIAYYWITHNISYDCEGYRNNNGLYELDDVLKQRKGVCSGYASLMKYFCDELEVECVVVEGFANGIGVRNLQKDSLSSNHAWNAVKINGQWKLVDATWGSGSANDDCTKTYPEFKERFFYAKPEELIKTHFPEQAEWQLLDTVFTAGRFVEEINKRMMLAAAEENPRDSVIRRKTGGTIRFLFKRNDERNEIMLAVYDKPGKEPVYTFDTLRVAADSSYYYDYKVKKSGYYRIDVSLFYEKGDDAEMHGTPIETYFIQTGPMPAPKQNPAVKKQ